MVKSFKQRREALGLSLSQVAGRLGMHGDVSNALGRLEAGNDNPGLAERYGNALDSWEHDGVPVPEVAEAWKPTPDQSFNPKVRWQEQPTREAQLAARRALAAQHAAQIAKWNAEDAARRDANNNKHREQGIARVEFGARLIELRDQAGITQAQVGLLLGFDANTISRLERGIPTHLREVGSAAMTRVEDAYELAARLGSKKAPG